MDGGEPILCVPGDLRVRRNQEEAHAMAAEDEKEPLLDPADNFGMLRIPSEGLCLLP